MKKVDSPFCVSCGNNNIIESDSHILLQCDIYQDIREKFLTMMTLRNNDIVNYNDNTDILLTAILDPESPSLPEDIRTKWKSLEEIYSLSRDFCHNVHKKREKILENINKVDKSFSIIEI